MNVDELKKRCTLATVRAEAMEQIRPDHTARTYFDHLLAQRDYSSCVRLFPHLVPIRVAIWWGCQCLWHTFAMTPSAELLRTLPKVVRWVADPSEANRQGVGPISPQDANALMWSTPGCMALAVWWTDGTLGEPEWPVIAPPGYASPRLVAGAVMRAAVEIEPMEYQEHYRQYLDLAMHLVARRNLWTREAAAPVVPNFEGFMPSVAIGR